MTTLFKLQLLLLMLTLLLTEVSEIMPRSCEHDMSYRVPSAGLKEKQLSHNTFTMQLQRNPAEDSSLAKPAANDCNI